MKFFSMKFIRYYETPIPVFKHCLYARYFSEYSNFRLTKIGHKIQINHKNLKNQEILTQCTNENLLHYPSI